MKAIFPVILALLFLSGCFQMIPALPQEKVYALVATGEGLEVFDVTATPVSISFVSLANSALDVEVSGQYAFLADGQSGIHVLDVSDPENPVQLNQLNTHYAYGVDLSGDYLYVADWTNGLLVYNVTDPSSPVLVARLEEADWAEKVHISGNRAYVACYNEGLKVVDVSNPANPVFLERVNFGTVRSVFVSDERIYAVVYGEGVSIIDANYLSQILGTYESQTPYDVIVSDSVLYLADYAFGVQTIDVSDPGNPFVLDHIPTSGGKAQSLWLYEGFLYIADFNGYLTVVDVSDPSHMNEVFNVLTQGSANAVSLLVQ